MLSFLCVAAFLCSNADGDVLLMICFVLLYCFIVVCLCGCLLSMCNPLGFISFKLQAVIFSRPQCHSLRVSECLFARKWNVQADTRNSHENNT